MKFLGVALLLAGVALLLIAVVNLYNVDEQSNIFLGMLAVAGLAAIGAGIRLACLRGKNA